jgi:phenylacetate-coenzyme A ligase PaaK-like adenylate-forming protein
MDEVTVVCESMGDDGTAAAARLAEDLRMALGVRIECRAVAPGSLPRAELKSRRLVRV